MERSLLPPLVAAALLVSGCATVISGSSQKINVSSVPEGARCTLTQDGNAVGTVESTPGTIEVGKARGHLKVTCTKAGYLESVVTAASHYNTSTLWNHAGFGIIGLGVDSASGALYHYVPDVTVTMLESEFDSETSRDSTFYAMSSIAKVEAAGIRSSVLRGCLSECDAKARALDQALDKRLAQIEAMRASAKVRRPAS